MWTVLAPVVRWPLYSPRRLTAVVVGLIAVVMIMGNCSGQQPEADSAPRPAATATASPQPTTTPTLPPTPSTPPAVPDDPSDEDAPTSSEQVGAEVAAGFVTAWARPDLAVGDWMDGLRPIITDRLTAELDGADPASAPALAVAAEPIVVDATSTTAVFDVPTTGAVVRVHLVDADGTWLADRLELL